MKHAIVCQKASCSEFEIVHDASDISDKSDHPKNTTPIIIVFRWWHKNDNVISRVREILMRGEMRGATQKVCCDTHLLDSTNRENRVWIVSRMFTRRVDIRCETACLAERQPLSEHTRRETPKFDSSISVPRYDVIFTTMKLCISYIHEI
jgi:hypothetical protein